jgi:hypothetical protein
MKQLVIFFLFLISSIASAAQVKMAVITSEFDSNVRDYFVEMDSNNHIHSMRYTTTAPNGAILEDVTATPDQVVEEGLVVFRHRGYDAVILEVENFNITTGGTIRINYLSSGLTGLRQKKYLSLKLLDGEFQLFDGPKRINRMLFEVNRSPILGVIGVKSIKTSFDPKFH